MRYSTITLTGGRGTVYGVIVHSNPNYTYVVSRDRHEHRVPAELIAAVTHHAE